MKQPYSLLKVYRWISLNEKQLYIFDIEGTYKGDGIVIKEAIFKDDNLETALNKIAVYIQQNNNNRFYTWNANESLLFNIDKPIWKGYNINPFKSSDHMSEELKESITYSFNLNKLFNFKIINIVFENDLPKTLQKNKYYFTDLKNQTYKFYKKHDEKLLYLNNLNAKNIKITKEIYSRINFYTKIDNILLFNLFDNIHASKNIDMVQWIDDTSKILYKLYQKHKISTDYFTSWTNIDKINKINVINIYSIIGRNSYCKISIDNDGIIMFQYFLDSRRYIKWEDIENHKKNIINILQNIIKKPLKLEEISLNLNINFEINNASIRVLLSKISEYVNIFHVTNNTNKNILCTYKRSSNYAQNIDIYDYIKSRMNLGISKTEIIQELNNLGITGDLENLIDNETNIPDNKINIKENGTLLSIQSYSQGFNISITNCPNRNELHYLLFWISKIMSISILTGKALQKELSPKTPSEKSSSSISEYSSSSSIEHGSIDFDLDGGGPGLRQNYFINMLQEADKDLFVENYARDKCQNASQPIVITKEYKEQLEKNNQLHFDNIIEYGSNPNIQNYYACPRKWCPQSKIPLNPDNPNAKCPIDNEEPMLLYWDNNKDKKRYVKLIKANDKGMCVPCCMKKEPKDDEISKCKAFLKKDSVKITEPIIDKIDENYIMNQSAPIPIGRYGSIPEYLHNILFDGEDIKAEACIKTFNKTHSCYTRTGIENKKNDSIILSIIELLSFKNKKDFIRDIKNKLDLLTFISLENGLVCKNFMNINTLNNLDTRNISNLYNKFKKNSKLYNLNLLDSSRALNIYNAYLKYLEYISSDNFVIEKDPKYLYSLIYNLYNVNLLIWEKIENSDEIYYYCHDIYRNDLNTTIGFILKDNKYYEPIIYKMRSSNPIKLFKINKYPLLKEIIDRCDKKYNMEIYKNIYSLNNWVNSKVLKKYNQFKIKTVFINDDLNINKILLNNNILLKFNNIDIELLPIFIKDLGITNNQILFYNDRENKDLLINIFIQDIEKFSQKCNELNIQIELGNLNGQIDDEISYTLILKPDNINNTLMLYTNHMNEFQNSLNKSSKISKKWYELQKMVAEKLINNFSEDNINLDRRTKIQKLEKLFNFLPEKELKKVHIILEEIPIYSIEHIKKWLNNIIITSKYDYFNETIKMINNQFIFSQNALVKNNTRFIPDYLLKYHTALPNLREKVNENIITIELSANRQKHNNIEMLPKIFEGSLSKLPSKWYISRKGDWSNYVQIMTKYDNNTIKDFVNWLANILGLKITYNEVLEVSKKKYINILNNEQAMIEILSDPYYFNSWKNQINKICKTPQMFWEKYYSKFTEQQRYEYLKKILEQEIKYPNDLQILSISELLNISILVLHRAKYGNKEADDARGDIKDFKTSSTLYPANSNITQRPVILLHRDIDKKFEYTKYYIVVDNRNPHKINFKYDDLPKEIKLLIDFHMRK